MACSVSTCNAAWQYLQLHRWHILRWTIVNCPGTSLLLLILACGRGNDLLTMWIWNCSVRIVTWFFMTGLGNFVSTSVVAFMNPMTVEGSQCARCHGRGKEQKAEISIRVHPWRTSWVPNPTFDLRRNILCSRNSPCWHHILLKWRIFTQSKVCFVVVSTSVYSLHSCD